MGYAGDSFDSERIASETEGTGVESKSIVVGNGVSADSLLGSLSADADPLTGDVLTRRELAILILVSILIGFVIGAVIVLYRWPSSSVRFTYSVQDIGDVCAGELITQENEMVVSGPAYIQMAATIYDDSTRTALYPLTATYVLAAANDNGSPYVIRDVFTWEAPSLPPKRYKRVLAAATYRNQEPITTVTSFNLIKCDADGTP
jgi:hypothetical protein